jgi:hypothetical protein
MTRLRIVDGDLAVTGYTNIHKYIHEHITQHSDTPTHIYVYYRLMGDEGLRKCQINLQ